MIWCFLLRRKLYDYADRTLPVPERARVFEHIQRCAHCSATVRRIESVLKVAGTQKVPQPQKEFWNRFESALDAQIDARSVPDVKPAASFRYRVSFALPAFAAICIVLISAHVYQRQYVSAQRVSPAEQRLVKETLDYEFETAQTSSADEDSLQYDIDLLDELESNSVS